MDVKKELIELRKELFDFSRRNPFVDVRQNKLWFQDETEDRNLPEKLYKKANFYLKEYGLETSLEVYVFLKWLPPSENKATHVFITSPLLYRPAKIKRTRKIETTYNVEIKTEKYCVNPILRHHCKLLFDLELPIETDNCDEIIALVLDFFNNESAHGSSQILKVDHFNEEENWQLIEQTAVGIFNYKKSALGADYDSIIENPNVQVNNLLTGEVGKELKKGTVEKRYISVLDYSQKMVLDAAIAGDTVIQGPPGTGKSHTIVALIGAFLLEQKRVLFVSEKRSALNVVYERLKQKKLDPLVAYFNTDKDQKKAFYANLKATWEYFGAHNSSKAVGSMVKKKSLFELYPTKLSAIDERLGTSLSELISVLLNYQKSPGELNGVGKIPVYGDWQQDVLFLREFEKSICPVFNVDSIGSAAACQLNSAVFSEPEVMLVLEKRLRSMETVLAKINGLQTVYELTVSLEEFIKLALTASILNMVDKVQIDLLNTDSKKYKSFNTWAKKYQLVKTKLHQAELANKKWSQKPSLSEITELLGLLQVSERNQGNTVLRLLRRNPAKLKTAFKDFHAGIGVHTKIKLLESLQMEWRLKGEFEEVKVKLKHNLNIQNPATEIDLIFNLRNKLNALSQNEYIRILEHEKSGELILALSQIHPDIVQFNAQNRFLFRTHEVDSMQELGMRVELLKAQLPQINHWLPELKKYYKITPSVRNFVQENEKNVAHLNAIVAYQNLLEATRFEPDFKNLSGWDLIEDGKRVKRESEAICQENITVIKETVREVHEGAEILLGKPNFKLNEEDKALKKRYKNEKRIILHEVNKQQRHLSVKSFFEDTCEHLLKIQPVWMMNPLTVSENLPCKADLFDVIIFDESSQIPLEDAIPAIYRSKQVIVVGDSKQMPPSAFFTSKEETKTLLDQSEQVFPNQMLKWHYRSMHPDLIQFSNREFYQNELVTFPPQSLENSIEVKLIQGNYDTGRNEIEAKEIARYCASLTTVQRNKTLIIAFSQEQEKEVQRQLIAVGIKIDADLKGIRTRNLENAQGIESELVVVSIGYGKNPQGDFRLNFGPVNQVNGANRLNVLFTRAIKKMVVFTSVQSIDFGLSENKGVAVLKDFLAFAENGKRGTSMGEEKNLAQKKVMEILEETRVDMNYYPAGNGIGFSSFIDHKKNKIILVDPGMGADQFDSHLTEDVSSLLTVLLDHYKEVKVILSLDLWQNPERVKADLRSFLNE